MLDLFKKKGAQNAESTDKPFCNVYIIWVEN